MIGLSFDTPEENAAFRDRHGFGFELWSDTGRTLGMAYGAARGPDEAHARRHTAILDEDGELVWRYRSVVNVLGHPAAVLEVCEALFGAKEGG